MDGKLTQTCDGSGLNQDSCCVRLLRQRTAGCEHAALAAQQRQRCSTGTASECMAPLGQPLLHPYCQQQVGHRALQLACSICSTRLVIVRMLF